MIVDINREFAKRSDFFKDKKTTQRDLKYKKHENMHFWKERTVNRNFDLTRFV